MACWAAFGLFAILACLSAGGFVYQVRLRDEFGEPFRNQPGAWSLLAGHLLRATLAAVLAWGLWRYLRALDKLEQSGRPDFGELFRSLAGWWYSLALCGLVVAVYGLWLALSGASILGDRSLSPRFTPEPAGDAVRVEIRLAEDMPDEGLLEARWQPPARPIYLHKEPLITNEDITEARVVQDEKGLPAVEVTFSPNATTKISEATAAHRGRPMAIIVDGKVVTAPLVLYRIGERAQISGGGFTHEECVRIAKGLTGKK